MREHTGKPLVSCTCSCIRSIMVAGVYILVRQGGMRSSIDRCSRDLSTFKYMYTFTCIENVRFGVVRVGALYHE